MGRPERRRKSITKKTLIGIILITSFTGLIILATGFSMYILSVVREYRENLCDLAKAELSVVDERELAKKTGEIIEIYDRLSPEERGDGTGEEYRKHFEPTIDDSFRSLQKSMQTMQNDLGLRNAFVTAIDPDSGRMIYLIDADPDLSTFCYPGSWEEYTPDEMNLLVKGAKTNRLQRFLGVRNDYKATITNTKRYGLRITAGEPVYMTEKYVVMMCLDEKLDEMVRISKLFLINYIMLLLLVIGIATFIAIYAMRKNVVRPLTALASAARGYAEDKANGVMTPERFISLDLRTGDEIEELERSMKDMEQGLAEYEKNLREVTAEQERIKTELDLAARIQENALPNIFPPYPERSEFDLFASMTPAKMVGGDFYDFFLIDDDHLAVEIADVSGKGIPGALFMMVSKIMLSIRIRAGDDPAEALRAVNEQICRNNTEEMFVTVWLGILDLRTGVMTAANAGHEYPVIMDEGGAFELLKDRHGFVIGGMEGVQYRNYEIRLKPGSKIFVYTDGLPEAQNGNEEFFGIDRTVESLNRIRDGSPEEILEGMKAAVDEFAGDEPPFDDLTMLCLKYNG